MGLYKGKISCVTYTISLILNIVESQPKDWDFLYL